MGGRAAAGAGAGGGPGGGGHPGGGGERGGGARLPSRPCVPPRPSCHSERSEESSELRSCLRALLDSREACPEWSRRARNDRYAGSLPPTLTSEGLTNHYVRSTLRTNVLGRSPRDGLRHHRRRRRALRRLPALADLGGRPRRRPLGAIESGS